ncbi:MAG: hypothetical protein JOZ36_14995 [Acidobacteria bacterium]|nr:hypothetical protein [Acidobacteriota bacterium]
MGHVLSRLPFLCVFALLTTAVSLSAANARSTTGFGAFKVQDPYMAPTNNPNLAGFYGCLLEDNGAVYNNCGVDYQPTLVFDLPIDNTGNHGIVIQPYWGNSQLNVTPTPFQCTAYAYAGNQPMSTVGTSAVFSMGGPAQTVNVNVSNNGMSVALICWNVPFGEGIANINWSA